MDEVWSGISFCVTVGLDLYSDMLLAHDIHEAHIAHLTCTEEQIKSPPKKEKRIDKLKGF